MGIVWNSLCHTKFQHYFLARKYDSRTYRTRLQFAHWHKSLLRSHFDLLPPGRASADQDSMLWRLFLLNKREFIWSGPNYAIVPPIHQCTSTCKCRSRLSSCLCRWIPASLRQSASISTADDPIFERTCALFHSYTVRDCTAEIEARGLHCLCTASQIAPHCAR